MAEEKSIRLAAASKEFNVGVQHIVEFLQRQGYAVDNKPTTKLNEEMYYALLKEYSKDKVLKEKADQVNIGLARKTEKPEEEVIVAKKSEQAKVKKEENVTPVKETLPVDEKTKADEVPQEEIIKAKSEKLEKPKVIAKIDIDGEKGKKKPAVKKAVKQKAEQEKTEAELPQLEPVPEAEITVTEDTQEEKQHEVVRENTAEKKGDENTGNQDGEMIETKKVILTGPKVLGKITIAESPEKKPDKKNPADSDSRKRRKRIKTQKPVNVDKHREEERRQQRRDPRKTVVVDPEEQERIIQEQVRNTLAKMSGTSQTGKSSKAKAKLRRQQNREKAVIEEEIQAAQSNVLQVAEFTSLSELASLMNVPATELIVKCVELGMMVSINQRLDAEIIELLADEFNFKLKFINASDNEEEEIEEADDPASLQYRAPIVTIMGHVDHGKTSLLDYIREANVVAGEKGGITQHIGAYDVVVNGDKHIAFLDTPGHEAFTAMRARGAKLTDIAVIVIAADDEIMPQTREAISHAQAAGVPMVFAINKIDKPGANPERIKEQLAQLNILVEDWGGKFQSQEISAKTGLNVNLLLEKILLEAELLDLKANPDKPAVGTTIEAALDKGRGYTCNIMVQEGTLRNGDMMVAGPYYGRVKAMFNERNQKVKEAGPSTPVLVLGLNGAPQAGEKFKVYADENEAKSIANRRTQIIREQGIRTKKHITLEEIGRRKALGTFRELNIIIKADVDGSAEALTDSLLKLSTEEVQVNVIYKSVGQITESDIMLASASDAVIVGFQVRPTSAVRHLAEKEGVEIRLYSIIYDAIEEVKSAMEGMLAPKLEEKIICTVEVRETFKISKIGTVAGCNVQEGKITRNTKLRLIRDGIVIFSGQLDSLKRFKDDVKEVTAGMDCGITIKNFNDIKVGDIIEGYEEVETKRTL